MAKTGTATRPRQLGDPTKLGRDFRRRLQSKDILIGVTATEYLRPSLVKLYCAAGYDYIFIENEHVIFNGPSITDFVLCARDNGIPIIAKVGQLDRAETARMLEMGVTGIQLPRTETREQLLELYDYVKFAPQGSRAGAPLYGNVDYIWPANDRTWLKKANDSTVIVVHIETKLAYENAEEIITTPGVNMVYVGPYDFSISMGQPGNYDHPDVVGPIRNMLKLCVKHKVAFGTSTSTPKAAAALVKRGCRFFHLGEELTFIREASQEAYDAYRAACGKKLK